MLAIKTVGAEALAELARLPIVTNVLLDRPPTGETERLAVAQPERDVDGPLQFQVSALDYSSYVGRIGIGRDQGIERIRWLAGKRGEGVLDQRGNGQEAYPPLKKG